MSLPPISTPPRPPKRELPGTRSVVRYWIEVSDFLVTHGEFRKILEECGLVFTEHSLTIPSGFSYYASDLGQRHFFLVEDAEAAPELEGKLVSLTLQQDLLNKTELDAATEAYADGVELDGIVPVVRFSITGRDAA